MTADPLISIVMPAYNGSGTLPAALASIERLTFDRARFEVIVVDDGSTDATPEILAEFARRTPLAFRSFKRDRSKGSGAGLSRNDGQDAARGRIIAFTDHDVVVDADWLSVIERAIVVEGRAMASGETWCEETVIFPWKMSPAGQRGITANLAYDRERCGLLRFETRFQGLYGEDTDFVLRAKALGFEATYVPAMRVMHPVRRMRLSSVLTRSLWRKNEVLLYRLYGPEVATSFGSIFRPVIAGRVSIAAVLTALMCSAIVLLILRPVFLAYFAAAASLAAAAFVLYFYRWCVMYRPAGALRVSLKERLITLVHVAAYLPAFTVAHLIGSLEFGFFLL